MKQLNEAALDARIKSFLAKKYQKYPELAPEERSEKDQVRDYDVIANISRYLASRKLQPSL